MKIMTQKMDYNSTIEFALFSNVRDARVKDLVWEKYDKDNVGSSTIGTLTYDDAQSLFQELWDHGCRPNDGFGKTGHIEVLTGHLQDMRKIVSKFLKVKL